MERRYMTIAECGAYIGYSRSTIYSWCCARKIPFCRRGGRLRFDRRRIDAWMDEVHHETIDPIKSAGD
jgi:excisionase family DNA binding protein